MSPEVDPTIAVRLSEAGLSAVRLPSENAMRTVNAWIVDDDPLTLVDAGTRSPEALRALEQALAAVGRRLEDVGLVVLTHHHTDHLGLVGTVAARSGADVAALAPIGPYLADYAREAARDRAFSAALLRRHGADEELVAGHRDGWAAFHALADPAEVSVPLVAGSRITLRDRTLEVLHRPGHSETDVLLVDADRRLAIGGDHLLAGGPSVPVRDRPLAGERAYAPETDDVAVLRRYRASLSATRELPVDLVVPGHGRPFGDPAAVVDAHLARQEAEADRLLARLGDEPTTAVGLTRRGWPAVGGALAFVAVGSVLGGLGLLLEDGRVERVDDDPGPPRFRAT